MYLYEISDLKFKIINKFSNLEDFCNIKIRCVSKNDLFRPEDKSNSNKGNSYVSL